MNWELIGKNVGIGAATGVSIILLSIIILVPISFMMNRYIYHTVGMRIAIGIFSGLFSLPIFVLICGMLCTSHLPQAHYFGLLPILPSYAPATIGTGWIMPFILSVFYAFKSLVTMNVMAESKDAYKHAIESGMNLLTSAQKTVTIPMIPGITTKAVSVSVCPGAVCEQFMHAAQQVGTLATEETWATAIAALSATGKSLSEEPTA